MKQQSSTLTLALLWLTLAFAACTTDTRKETPNDPPSNAEFGNLPPALADSLKTLGAPLQFHSIDAGSDQVIKGQKGTRLYIPANCFLDENGDPVSGSVTVQLKEHFSMADFVTSNLQTIHDSDILQTQGMIYFAATTESGSKLSIDKSKPLRIEIPVKEKVADAKIFIGRRDAQGQINWGQIEEPSKLLVPFPIRTLASQNMGECPSNFGITNDPDILAKPHSMIYYTEGEIDDYENTLLATREFYERFYSYCMPDLTKIYIDNLDKNLWEIDKLAVQLFIQDSTERVSFSLNNIPPGPNGGPRTKDQTKAHEWLLQQDMEYGHRMISIYKEFAAQKLTKIDPTKKIPDATLAETNVAFVAYDALEFGWVNVDYFYRDSSAAKVKLFVEANADVSIMNLIFPTRNIILSGIAKEGRKYSFTKEEEGYGRLPKGEKAILICIGISGTKLSYAQKEILIGQNETESIDLQPATSPAIQQRLAALGT